jgi:AAA domain
MATSPTTDRLLAAQNKSMFLGLDADSIKKQQTFYDTRVRHSKLDALTQDLFQLLTPHSESNIIVVTGASGVGKTTLTNKLLKSLYVGFAPIYEMDPSAIPLLVVEAVANGERHQGFRGLLEDMRNQLLEPGPEQKSLIQVVDGRMIVRPQARATTLMLRKVVENGLRMRKTMVCAIDEAYHLLSLGKHAEVMDTFKSMANTTGLKIVLLGSFDLYDLVVGHAQVARRATILNFDRYHLDKEEDRAEFKKVVELLQAKWPCALIPNFTAISDELLEATLGCVGLLKTLMLDALAMQLRAGGKWNPQFLMKAAKSNALRGIIEKEIIEGEAKVLDALYGDSMWNKSDLDSMAKKMEVAYA